MSVSTLSASRAPEPQHMVPPPGTCRPVASAEHQPCVPRVSSRGLSWTCPWISVGHTPPRLPAAPASPSQDAGSSRPLASCLSCWRTRPRELGLSPTQNPCSSAHRLSRAPGWLGLWRLSSEAGPVLTPPSHHPFPGMNAMPAFALTQPAAATSSYGVQGQ